ncbi:MAG: hypothetical protein U1E59_02045 [Amaricoccus sp.]
MTEPFAAFGGRRPGPRPPASPMGTTLRRVEGADGDRLLVRSRYTYHPGLDAGDATLRRAGAVHDGKFAHRFPTSPAPACNTASGAMALT